MLLCCSVLSRRAVQSSVADPPGLSASLVAQKQKDRRFLEQLLDGSKLANYSIPVPIKAELRKYQQVNMALARLLAHAANQF